MEALFIILDKILILWIQLPWFLIGASRTCSYLLALKWISLSTTPHLNLLVIFHLILWWAGLVQWWERSPPANVSRVRFPHPVSCGLSLLVLYSAAGSFSLGTPVFLSPQKPTFLNSNSIWIIVKHFIMSPWLGWLCKHSLCLTLNLHLHLHGIMSCLSQAQLLLDRGQVVLLWFKNFL